MYFDQCNNSKDLVEHLTPLVKIIAKFDPIFTFKVRDIFNSSLKSILKNIIKKNKDNN